ncbi:hypothetical protein [Microbacterium oxydans]|uniref:hypothetical protein n=1 Tax=Microbacterium oxydans TaxID=82380 RepID=UPI0022B0DAB9|nr:hypothetical protein [Microbacterium oxydans]
MAAVVTEAGTLVRERMAWERDFTQIPNVYARDKDLSWVARGILIWLMTHDAGYQVTMGAIEAGSWKEGREAVRSAVAELEKAGYLHRQQKRGKGGRLAGYVFHLRDPFQLPVVGAPQLPIGSLQAVDNSHSTGDGFPSSGAVDNPTGGRVAVDGKPSTKKNTKVRTTKDPAQPQQPLGAPVDNFGAVRWADDECPAAWSTPRLHELGPKSGACTKCGARPIVRSVG